jgi:hypothetical protein
MGNDGNAVRSTDRREFLRDIAARTAFAAPLVASFSTLGPGMRAVAGSITDPIVLNFSSNQLFIGAGNQLIPIGGNQAYVFGGNQFFMAGSNQLLVIGGNQLFLIGGNQIFPLGGNQTYPLGGLQVFPPASNQTMTVGGNQQYFVIGGKFYTYGGNQPFEVINGFPITISGNQIIPIGPDQFTAAADPTAAPEPGGLALLATAALGLAVALAAGRTPPEDTAPPTAG